MDIKYCYVTKHKFSNGEYQVEGHSANGSLIFGFRTFDSITIQEQARFYTPKSYIPVFDKRPEEVK